MPLTASEVFEEVVTSLGGSSVAVELTERDLQIALKDAMRRYSRSFPLRDRESAVISPQGLRTVELHPETYAVTEVEFQDSLNVIEGKEALTFDVFLPYQIIGAQGIGAGGTVDAFEYGLLKQWRDITRREFSLEPDWYFEEDVQFDESDDVTALPRKFHAFNPTGLNQRVMFVALRRRELRQVSPRDEDWVIGWTAAHAKEILGRKRNKHKNIPTAGEQVLKLDGSDLLEEARVEKEALIEDLKGRSMGMPSPIYG